MHGCRRIYYFREGAFGGIGDFRVLALHIPRLNPFIINKNQQYREGTWFCWGGGGTWAPPLSSSISVNNVLTHLAVVAQLSNYLCGRGRIVCRGKVACGTDAIRCHVTCRPFLYWRLLGAGAEIKRGRESWSLVKILKWLVDFLSFVCKFGRISHGKSCLVKYDKK